MSLFKAHPRLEEPSESITFWEQIKRSFRLVFLSEMGGRFLAQFGGDRFNRCNAIEEGSW
jgi:hypothetical protein